MTASATTDLPNKVRHAAADGTSAGGRIGPNAVTQLIPALQAGGFGSLTDRIFTAATAPDWLIEPPSAMVDERRVARLHRTVRAMIGPEQSVAVMAGAGRLTADYLLAVRIPRSVQRILVRLPAPISTRLLVMAIRSHAWTFAGSGRFSVHARTPLVFELDGNPLCAGEQATAPVCAWHAAVLQRLFQVLICPDACVTETNCEAAGDASCRFVVRLPA
jgi:divinyl protochlorophyllide a 8-vinyl-reductase